jgi:hypothetical protein
LWFSWIFFLPHLFRWKAEDYFVQF